jgi:WD40 repeat protein
MICGRGNNWPAARNCRFFTLCLSHSAGGFELEHRLIIRDLVPYLSLLCQRLDVEMVLTEGLEQSGNALQSNDESDHSSRVTAAIQHGQREALSTKLFADRSRKSMGIWYVALVGDELALERPPQVISSEHAFALQEELHELARALMPIQEQEYQGEADNEDSDSDSTQGRPNGHPNVRAQTLRDAAGWLFKGYHRDHNADPENFVLLPSFDTLSPDGLQEMTTACLRLARSGIFSSMEAMGIASHRIIKDVLLAGSHRRTEPTSSATRHRALLITRSFIGGPWESDGSSLDSLISVLPPDALLRYAPPWQDGRIAPTEVPAHRAYLCKFIDALASKLTNALIEDASKPSPYPSPIEDELAAQLAALRAHAAMVQFDLSVDQPPQRLVRYLLCAAHNGKRLRAPEGEPSSIWPRRSTPLRSFFSGCFPTGLPRRTARTDRNPSVHGPMQEELSSDVVSDDALSDFITRMTDAHEPARVLAVAGSEGSGKSALIAWSAMAIMRWLSWPRPVDAIKKETVSHGNGSIGNGPIVCVRFVGRTACSASVTSLLHSICSQIALAFGAPPPRADEVHELSVRWHKWLQLATAARPILLVIDSIDACGIDEWAKCDSSHHTSALFRWLPLPTPPENVWLLLSCSTKSLPTLSVRLSNATSTFTLDPISAKTESEILLRTLSDAGRTLQPSQVESCELDRTGCGNPLYARLLAAIARGWSADTQPPSLPADVRSIAQALFNAAEKQHGTLLVQATCGLLSAARDGLSEGELQHILSLDNELLCAILTNEASRPRIARVPAGRLHELLRTHLDSILYESSAAATGAPLLRWNNPLVMEVARKRYGTRRWHRQLADFFTGATPTPMSPLRMQDGSVVNLPADRAVPDQSLSLVCNHTYPVCIRYNRRAMRELPAQLVGCGALQELAKSLISLRWLSTTLTALGSEQLLQGFEMVPPSSECTSSLDTRPYNDECVVLELRVLLKVLRSCTNSIAAEPEQLEAQLLARLPHVLRHYPGRAPLLRGLCVEVELSMAKLAASRGGVLRPLWPCLPVAQPQTQILHKGQVAISSFDSSEDGSLFVAAYADGSLSIFNRETVGGVGSCIARVHVDADCGLIASCSKGGRCLFVCSDSKSLLKTMHLSEDGKVLQTTESVLQPHLQSCVTAIASLDSGKLIATADSRGLLIIWEREGSKIMTVCSKSDTHTGVIRALALANIPASAIEQLGALGGEAQSTKQSWNGPKPKPSGSWCLENLLANSEGASQLRAFCVKELSEESIAFLEDAQRWKRAWAGRNVDTRQKTADVLVAMYLQPGADLEVCVPGGWQVDRETMAHEGMFDHAIAHAHKTLTEDILPRFETSEDGAKVKADILQKGVLSSAITEHSGARRSVRSDMLHPVVVSGSNDGAITISLALSDHCLHSLQQSEPIESIHASSTLLISASPTGSIRLWDLLLGVQLARFPSTATPASCIRLLTTGTGHHAEHALCAMGSAVATICLHDVTHVDPRYISHTVADVHETRVTAIALDEVGRTAITSVGAFLARWDLQNAMQLGQQVQHGHCCNLSAVALDTEGEVALAGAIDGSVSCWNATEGGGLKKQPMLSLPSTGTAIRALAVTERGLGLSLDSKGLCGSWAWAAGEGKLQPLTLSFGDPSRAMEACAIAYDDGAMTGALVVLSGAHCVEFFDLHDAQESTKYNCQYQYCGHDSPIDAVALYGGSEVLSSLAASVAQSNLHLWRSHDGTPIARLTMTDGPQLTCLSLRGDHLMSGTESGTLGLFALRESPSAQKFDARPSGSAVSVEAMHQEAQESADTFQQQWQHLQRRVDSIEGERVLQSSRKTPPAKGVDATPMDSVLSWGLDSPLQSAREGSELDPAETDWSDDVDPRENLFVMTPPMSSPIGSDRSNDDSTPPVETTSKVVQRL